MGKQKPCISHRIRLEKLKQETWRLVILARILVFLTLIVSHCLR